MEHEPARAVAYGGDARNIGVAHGGDARNIGVASGGDFPLGPLEIIAPALLQGVAVPAREWIWEGWIPVGAVTALYGDGGTGKSLLAQQLMTACATGALFLGQEVAPCKTLGVFCEDDGDELHRRQVAVNRALGVDFKDLGDMGWISRVGCENLLMTFEADGRGLDTPFFSQILNTAKDFGARVIVIDTAADAFAGNENIRPQVRQFIALLTRLAREIGGAVILLAHPSQTGKASGEGAGGSTAWNNSVRSRLYLKRPGNGDGNGKDKGQNNQDAAGGEAADPDLRIVSRLKANYAAAGVDLAVRYERGAFVEAGGAAGTIGARGPARNREAEEAFMSGLGELSEKNIPCNVHRGQANYAPKALREKTQGCEGFSETELTCRFRRRRPSVTG
jgi:RecA-family ATPase